MDRRPDDRKSAGQRANELDRHEWINLIERCRYDGREIARRLGISRRMVSTRLRKRGLSLLPKWQYRTQEDWDRLMAPYATLEDAGKALGFGGASGLRKALRARGIDHRFTCFSQRRRLEEIETETLVELYEQCDRRPYRVARLLGVNVTTVSRELDHRGIEVETWRPGAEGRIWNGKRNLLR